MKQRNPSNDNLLNDPRSDRRLTVKEASQTLGLAEVTIRAWIAKRRIGYVRLGRSVRIPLSEIQRLLEAGAVPARPRN
jgi:excisionase family DNA binding protein